MKVLMVISMMLLMYGCATGVSTYKYVHLADGSTNVEVKSSNEIEQMKMGINRETGTLEVEIGGMTKKSDTVEVLDSVKEIVHDVANPGSGLINNDGTE